MWGVLPISSWIVAELLVQLKPKVLLVVPMTFILLNSWINISHNNDTSPTILSLNRLEQISNLIIQDQPTGRYNVTESVTDDARFIAIRYFLMRDTKVKPQDRTGYTNLNRLYIISKAGQDDKLGERWEFTATPNLTKTKSFTLDGLVISRYEQR